MNYLPLTEILHRLAPAESEALVGSLPRSSHKEGEIIYSPGMGERVFIMQTGKVMLYTLSPQGQKQDVHTVGAMAIFGHMPLLGLELKDTYAEVVDEATLSAMDRDAFERLLAERPRLAISLLESLGKRLVETEASLEEAFKKVPARLACLILRLAGQQASTVRGFTHQQLADRIGTYRETTTMTLNLFKKRGLIEIGRKRLTILDLQGLKEIAEEG